MRPGDLTADYSCPDCGTGPELDHGRPGYRLDGASTGLSLSLSRSRGWALLAAAGTQGTASPGPGAPGFGTQDNGATVGIDLEHSSGVGFPGFDDVVLTLAERRVLAGLASGRAPLWRTAAWARKEALLKARGTGLRVDPATVEAFVEPPGAILIDLDTAALGLPAGYAAALALIGTE